MTKTTWRGLRRAARTNTTPSAGAGYKIYRWGYDGSQWRFLYHASVGTNITTFTDRGLNSASDYYYELSAYNANGESAHTTWIKGTTTSAFPLFLPFIRR